MGRMKTASVLQRHAAVDPENDVAWILPDYWGPAGPPPGHLRECHPDLIAEGTCWCRLVDDHRTREEEDPAFLFRLTKLLPTPCIPITHRRAYYRWRLSLPFVL